MISDYECIFYDSDCYKEARQIIPQGIVWHSTGVNQTSLGRYVQPSKNDKNYDYLLKEIGKNRYGNHWNQPGIDKSVHFMIGLNAEEKVKVVQCLPLTMACWGVASGINGSYNYDPTGYIQFEMLEDDLSDSSYFNNVLKRAIDLSANLCLKYDISPENVVSHHEAYQKGYGSNHKDPEHWLSKYGWTMQDIRNKIKSLVEEQKMSIKDYYVNVKLGPFTDKSMAETIKKMFTNATIDTTDIKTSLKIGQAVKLKPGATRYASTGTFAKWVYDSTLYIREIDGERIVVSIYTSGAITGAVNMKDLIIL